LCTRYDSDALSGIFTQGEKLPGTHAGSGEKSTSGSRCALPYRGPLGAALLSGADQGYARKRESIVMAHCDSFKHPVLISENSDTNAFCTSSGQCRASISVSQDGVAKSALHSRQHFLVLPEARIMPRTAKLHCAIESCSVPFGPVDMIVSPWLLAAPRMFLDSERTRLIVKARSRFGRLHGTAITNRHREGTYDGLAGTHALKTITSDGKERLEEI